jgi:hypothetical protein
LSPFHAPTVGDWMRIANGPITEIAEMVDATPQGLGTAG